MLLNLWRLKDTLKNLTKAVTPSWWGSVYMAHREVCYNFNEFPSP